MRPLKSSFNREETTRLLGITPEVLDALLDSGQILCHFRRGEALIPLEQLEAFFRDALIRIYQAEGRDAPSPRENAAPEPQPLPDVWHDARPVQGREDDRDADREEDPFEDPYAEAQPAGRGDDGEQPFAAFSSPDESSTDALGSDPLITMEPVDDRPELRVASRYVPLRQISGIFGDVKFTVLQLSATGLRIRHHEPLLPGDEAKLSFALLKPARSVVLRARVVWTSMARAGEDRFAISGLRVVEYGERLVRAIQDLSAVHELQPERRHTPRRENDTLTMLSGIRDEEIALVSAAIQKFANDPVEASRWYARARFALADENVRRIAPQRPREREEVLGIWEYLDRQVDIAKVAGVVTWMRGVDKATGV